MVVPQSRGGTWDLVDTANGRPSQDAAFISHALNTVCDAAVPSCDLDIGISIRNASFAYHQKFSFEWVLHEDRRWL